MSVRHASKYRVRSSRTSSASRDSLSPVNPTRSANRTETRRRSAVGAAAGGASGGPTTGAERAAASPSGDPHSPQNLTPGSFAAPQTGQPTASARPHSPQNFLPALFAAPQLEQVIKGLGGDVEPVPGTAGRPRCSAAGQPFAAMSRNPRKRSGRRHQGYFAPPGPHKTTD